MSQAIPTAAAKSRSMMAAVVLGTALGLSPELAQAATEERNPVSVDDISKYCQACWRNARLPADRWQDCTQQVLVRLLERVPTSKWQSILADGNSLEREEFVRAIDTVKKRTQRIKNYTDFNDDMTPRDQRIENRVQEERQEVTEIAPRLLSERQQKIVELSFNGWAIPDIASELGTTVQRISDEKYKAVQKLKTHLTMIS
jgi:RNA polymerase sigma factor (sigma-70 family)